MPNLLDGFKKKSISVNFGNADEVYMGDNTAAVNTTLALSLNEHLEAISVSDGNFYELGTVNLEVLGKGIFGGEYDQFPIVDWSSIGADPDHLSFYIMLFVPGGGD